ncbi:MAG: 50S ribosomal protein L23 [bacterium]
MATLDKKPKKTVKAKVVKPVVEKAENVSDKKEIKHFGILIKPMITEKAAHLSQLNKYEFEVSGKANKIQITQAIFERYHIKPIKVNVINKMGRLVRFGRTMGKKSDLRKAIVTLPKGKSIQIYEGV